MNKKCLLKNFCLGIIAASVLMLLAGCEDALVLSDDEGGVSASECAYGVNEIHVVGLTTLKSHQQGEAGSQLQVCLDLVDSFGSRIKAPGKFRFELYEFVSRSAQPMGKRLFISSDIDLFDAQDNDEYWHDYLRSYIFDLKIGFRVVAGTEYILQVTCLTGDGKRVTDTFQIKAQR